MVTILAQEAKENVIIFAHIYVYLSILSHLLDVPLY